METRDSMSIMSPNLPGIYQGVTLGDRVFGGSSLVLTSVFNPMVEIRKMNQVRPSLLKEEATIGAHGTINCGITIVWNAFVGASAVVARGVPAHALITGNSAIEMSWVCQCAEISVQGRFFSEMLERQ